MNADAIVMLVVAAGVIWGGLVASIGFLMILQALAVMLVMSALVFVGVYAIGNPIDGLGEISPLDGRRALELDRRRASVPDGTPVADRPGDRGRGALGRYRARVLARRDPLLRLGVPGETNGLGAEKITERSHGLDSRSRRAAPPPRRRCGCRRWKR